VCHGCCDRASSASRIPIAMAASNRVDCLGIWSGREELRHLKNVALLTPCFRSKSATGMPLSAPLRIPTIWLSLNFDFRMTAPDPEQSTFGCQSIGKLTSRLAIPIDFGYRLHSNCRACSTLRE
jgi:hypothetical protein